MSAVLLCCALSVQAESDVLTPFSRMAPGEVAAPWQLQAIRGRPSAEFSIVDGGQGDVRVALAVANASVASLFHPVELDLTASSILEWSWVVDDAIAGTDLYSKSGDDYPARVYVMFDYDISRLPVGARWKLRLARLIYGNWVPGAALCYVPAQGIALGTIAPNAYTDRVRMIVVDDLGAAQTGSWKNFSRNIATDYEAAFGEPAPPVIGVAIAIDTDDTGEAAAARFGDITFVR
jgi:hypothetical protein